MTESNPSLGEPVSHLSASRLCTHCHHDLVGQPVYRESHYGLVVARCPECGGFTPMLEYPTLGRWGRRLGALCAAAVLGLVLVFMLGSAGALCGISFAAGQLASNQVSQRANEGLRAVAGSRNWFFDRTVFDDWVAQTGGVRTIIADQGGLLRAIDWYVVYPLSALAFVALACGIVIAAFVPGQRGVRLLLVGVIPAVLALVYLMPWIISLGGAGHYGNGGRIDAAVGRMVQLPVVVGAWLFVVVPFLIVGTACGRPIARAIVRALLPVRHRRSFAYLWTCDGLRMNQSERSASS